MFKIKISNTFYPGMQFFLSEYFLSWSILFAQTTFFPYFSMNVFFFRRQSFQEAFFLDSKFRDKERPKNANLMKDETFKKDNKVI